MNRKQGSISESNRHVSGAGLLRHRAIMRSTALPVLAGLSVVGVLLTVTVMLMPDNATASYTAATAFAYYRDSNCPDPGDPDHCDCPHSCDS
jgi:hypothetical protein